MLFTHGKPFLPLGENSAGGLGIQKIEHSDAQQETILSTRLLARELAEAPEQLLLTLVRKRVDLAGLAALAGGFAFVDPTSCHKSPEERIDKIVVHLALA